MKTSKQKVLWFYDECWRVNFYVLPNTTPENVAEFIDNQFGLKYRIQADTAAARCYEIVDGEGVQVGIVIALHGWKMDAKWLSYLAHECFHAAEYVADRCGLKHCDKSSEAFAYLIESIFRRSLDRILKKK